MKEHGKLFGIGVGPGDPELITLKAVRMINQADVIFTASSKRNSYSLAVEIAQQHISSSAQIRTLAFSMTRNKVETQDMWDENAQKIARVLQQGKKAAFLTLGDPGTFSTFGYIVKSLEKIMPQAVIETIPGITSYQAAAARLNRVLVEAEESLLLTSGAYGGECLKKISNNIENIAVLKAYRNTKEINSALKDNGFSKNSVAISRCGRKGEEIIENIEDLETRSPDYWTLILAGK